MKMGAVQGQYGQFNSAKTILSNLITIRPLRPIRMIPAAFRPALLGRLFGIKEVEPFA